MIDEREINEIEERAKAATPGPWAWDHCWQSDHDITHWALINPDQPDGGVGDGFGRVINHRLVLRATRMWDGDMRLDVDPDFQFIAHARQDIPHLVTYIRELQSLLGNASDEIADLAHQLTICDQNLDDERRENAQIDEIRQLFLALFDYAKRHNGRISIECVAYCTLRKVLQIDS